MGLGDGRVTIQAATLIVPAPWYQSAAASKECGFVRKSFSPTCRHNCNLVPISGTNVSRGMLTNSPSREHFLSEHCTPSDIEGRRPADGSCRHAMIATAQACNVCFATGGTAFIDLS